MWQGVLAPRRKARNETATVRHLGGPGHHGFVLCDGGGGHRRQRDAARREPPQRLRRGTGPAPGRPDRQLAAGSSSPRRARSATPGSSSPSRADSRKRNPNDVSGFEGNAGPHGLEEYHAGLAVAVRQRQRHRRRPAETGHDLHVPGRPGRDPDDHLRQRLPGIPGPLGSQQHLRRRGQFQGARGRRLLLPGRRRRHRDLHRRAAALHRRHQPRHRAPPAGSPK